VSVYVVLLIISLQCLIPFILLFVSSFTEEAALVQKGYSFFPAKWSMDAYQYLWTCRSSIFHAYVISLGITILGTVLSLAVTTTMGYAISQERFCLKRFLTIMVIFSTLFHAGLAPTYIMYARYFSIKNTFAALLFPRLLMTGINVLIIRTFFVNSVPRALLESARLDGANEFQVFFHIALNMAKPMLATIGFLSAITYWNDWFNSFIYINDSAKLSLQGLLNRIILDIQFMASSEFAGEMTGISIPSVSVRMAIAGIAVVPVLILLPFFQKFLVKGISIGAVKG